MLFMVFQYVSYVLSKISFCVHAEYMILNNKSFSIINYNINKINYTVFYIFMPK